MALRSALGHVDTSKEPRVSGRSSAHEGSRGQAANRRGAADRRPAAHSESIAPAERRIPVAPRRDDAASRGRRVLGALPVQGGSDPEASDVVLPGHPRHEAAAGDPRCPQLPRGDAAARGETPENPLVRLRACHPQRRQSLWHVLRRRPHLRQGPDEARQGADGRAGPRRRADHRAGGRRASPQGRDHGAAGAAHARRRTNGGAPADRRSAHG